MQPLLLGIASLALSLPAAAQPAVGADDFGGVSYAVVVGSNQPGPGQQPLRWAVADAERVEQVFTELGGLSPERVLALEDPTPDQLLDGLDALTLRLEEHAAADERVSLLFYYSGHARSTGLDLGGEMLPLDDLRARLESMPAAVRLVVLDACQAGAVSDIKGVTPAKAFSTASVAGLDTEGMAVIASSTATELSQESDELQGSYFTHHFVVGLRGAADQDLDGSVTLDEAYRYAYDRTLVSTATTAVGRQHATLETDLRGRGALTLTRPGAATARLRFDGDVQGDILLVHDASGVVAAEVGKVGGDSLTLALSPGEYEVLWRQGAVTLQCRQVIDERADQPFAPVDCAEIVAEATAAKGDAPPDNRLERLALELSFGIGGGSDDGYTSRLADFGFTSSTAATGTRYSGALMWSPQRLWSVGVVAGNIEDRAYRRSLDDVDGQSHVTTFSWSTMRAAVVVRGQLPLVNGWVVPYLQAGGGVAQARSIYDDDLPDEGTTRQEFWGAHWTGAIGLQVMPSFGRKGWRHVGAYHQLELLTAPVMTNLLDDRHQSGGVILSAGLRLTL